MAFQGQHTWHSKDHRTAHRTGRSRDHLRDRRLVRKGRSRDHTLYHRLVRKGRNKDHTQDRRLRTAHMDHTSPSANSIRSLLSASCREDRQQAPVSSVPPRTRLECQLRVSRGPPEKRSAVLRSWLAPRPSRMLIGRIIARIEKFAKTGTNLATVLVSARSPESPGSQNQRTEPPCWSGTQKCTGARPRTGALERGCRSTYNGVDFLPSPSDGANAGGQGRRILASDS